LDESAVVGQPFSAGEGSQQLDGSAESQLAQGQRERAELHRFATEAMKLSIAELRHIIDTLNDQIEKLRNENEALRVERLEDALNEAETGKHVQHESATSAIVKSLMDKHSGEIVDAMKLLISGETTATTEPNGATK